MKLKIKNMTTSDLLNLYTDMNGLKDHKLEPDLLLNKETGYFELSIKIDAISINQEGLLYVEKKYVGAAAYLAIVDMRKFIIETEV